MKKKTTTTAAARTPVELFQFTVHLMGIRVWRRFVVPSSYTMAKFHMTLQAVMGWRASHMYEFSWMPDENSEAIYYCRPHSMSDYFQGDGGDPNEHEWEFGFISLFSVSRWWFLKHWFLCQISRLQGDIASSVQGRPREQVSARLRIRHGRLVDASY